MLYAHDPKSVIIFNIIIKLEYISDDYWGKSLTIPRNLINNGITSNFIFRDPERAEAEKPFIE